MLEKLFKEAETTQKIWVSGETIEASGQNREGICDGRSIIIGKCIQNGGCCEYVDCETFYLFGGSVCVYSNNSASC